MEPTFMLLTMFIAATQTFHLPQGLLSSICFVESNHKVTAMHYNDGGDDSAGICQIKPGTARMLGYKGSKQALRRPEVNIYWAAVYLAKQLKRYDNDVTKAVAAYNAGKYRPGKTGRPLNKKYVSKVFKVWVAQK